METQIPRRLAKNPRLHRSLVEGSERRWIEDGGVWRRALTIPITPSQLEGLFALVGRGLACFHWGVYLPKNFSVDVTFLTGAGEAFFEQHFFRLSARNRVRNEIGKGTVRYEGVQGVDFEGITVWRIWMYGGMRLGNPEFPESAGAVGIITGPPSAE
jgi:hypothetical protein